MEYSHTSVVNCGFITDETTFHESIKPSDVVGDVASVSASVSVSVSVNNLLKTQHVTVSSITDVNAATMSITNELWMPVVGS